MYLAGIRAALVDDARHLVAVYVGRVREQMSSVLVRFSFKVVGNIDCSVGVKMVAVSCVQSCVSELVTYGHFLRCITEIVIQYNIFSSQYVYQKTPYIVGERETYYCDAEIVRKLARVTRAVFVDEILDADFDVEHDASVLFPLILPFRIPKNELKSITQLLLIFFAEVVCVTIKHDFCFVEEFCEVVQVAFGVGGGIALRECGQIVGGGGLLQ